MKVNRSNLVKSLEKVVHALGINVLVPEFQFFQISGNRIQTTDGALLIDSPLPEGEAFDDFAVPGKGFFDLLRNLSEEEVDLIFKEDKLKVKTNKVVGTFAILNKVNFKVLNSIDEEISAEVLPDFLKGLSFCRFGVSKDETADPLCGVYVDGNTFFSTDKYRIVRWTLAEEMKFTCSLPVKFIEVLLRYKNEIQHIGYSKKGFFVAVLQDSTVIMSPVLSGDYPELLQYFPTSEYKEIEFVEKPLDVLEKHIDFLKKVTFVDKEILVEIVDNKCTFISTDKELGVLSEDIEISNKIDSKIEFNINPLFLKDIMKICSGFKYYDTEGLVLFETDILTYLVQIRR